MALPLITNLTRETISTTLMLEADVNYGDKKNIHVILSYVECRKLKNAEYPKHRVLEAIRLNHSDVFYDKDNGWTLGINETLASMLKNASEEEFNQIENTVLEILVSNNIEH